MAWLEFQTVSAGGILRRQLFTTNGTWTKPADIIGEQVWVTMIGGGSSGVSASFGPPGTSGQYYIREPLDVSAETSVAVTIGAGGTAVNGGGANANGDPGGASSFGALLSASGGASGEASGEVYLTDTFGMNTGRTSYNENPLPISGSFGALLPYRRGGVGVYGGTGLYLGPSTPSSGAGTDTSALSSFGFGAGGGNASDNASDSGEGAPGAVMIEWLEAL